MELGSVTTQSTAAGEAGGAARSAAGLESDDFFKLLIAQLTNQDPLEPTSNETLLAQISSIREIELSSTLTDSLRQLTGQQGFGSASALIGRYVTGLPGADGVIETGVVVAIRIADGGQPMLRLSSGAELSLEQIGTIESPMQAAEALVGQSIIGMDRRNAAEPELVEGLVTGVRVDDRGDVLLELDTGEDLRLVDVIGPASSS